MPYRQVHSRQCDNYKFTMKSLWDLVENYVDLGHDGHGFEWFCKCPKEFYHSLKKPHRMLCKGCMSCTMQDIYTPLLKQQVAMMPILRVNND